MFVIRIDTSVVACSNSASSIDRVITQDFKKNKRRFSLILRGYFGNTWLEKEEKEDISGKKYKKKGRRGFFVNSAMMSGPNTYN